MDVQPESQVSEEERGKKEQLAKQRSVLAKQRTLLAKQRTFSAWVRTALATITVGLAIAQLLGQEGPAWLIQAVGAGLIGVGIAILLVGLWSYRRTFRILQAKDIESLPVWSITGITMAMLLMAIVMLFIIFL